MGITVASAVFGIQAFADAETRRVTLVTGADYAPYTSENMPNGGVVSEVVTRVFEAAGYQSSLTFYPWKRAYSRVLNLQSDATFPYSHSAERAEDFLYSRPVNQINIRIFYHRENPVTYHQASDLEGLTYCQPLGYQAEPYLENMTNAGKLTRQNAPDMDACFRLLARQRADFVVSNDLVGWETVLRALDGESQSAITAAETPLRQIGEYVIIAKSHPNGQRLIDDFNRSYEQLKEAGVIREIWADLLGDFVNPSF